MTSPITVSPDATEAFAERDRLTIALRSLTPGQRKVVVLRHYEDMSETQVAALLGCSVGTVKSQNARALARLRLALVEPEHHTQTALATGTEAP